MKIENKLLSLLFLSVAFVFFAACSSDNDDSTTMLPPVFAEPINLSCNVGDVKEIEFNSETSWSITTGAIWCKLSLDGENYMYDVSGEAGTSKVFVKVGDEALDFNEASTVLTITREGQKEVIVNIHRSPKDYLLSLTDESGETCDKIKVASNGTVSFNVEANFDFGISEKPEWIDEFVITTSKEIPNKKNIYAVVSENFEAFPCTGTLLFMNSDNSVSFPYEISYSGMEPALIEIEGVNPWGWSLSSDGMTFSNSSSLSGEKIEYKGSVPYIVKSFKYDSRYLFFQEEGNDIVLMYSDEAWLKIEINSEDASQVAVTAEAYPPLTEGSRKGYMMAVPAALYEEFIALYNSNPTVSFIDEKYNYVMLEVTQTSDYVELTKGFDVNDAMFNKLDCFAETDEAYLAMIKEKFNISEVYAVSAEPGMYIHAYPHLTDLHWEGWNVENTVVVDAEGNEIEKSTVAFEIGMTMTDEYYISLQAQTFPIVIALKGVDGSYIKALVVKSSLTLDPGTGFTVKYRMVEDIPCELETDMELAAFIAKNYGVKEIYKVSTRVGRTLQIFPHLTEEEWNGGEVSSIKIIDTEGNPIELADVKYEPALDANDDFYASVIVKRNTFIMIFVDVNGKNIKAMVVRAN